MEAMLCEIPRCSLHELWDVTETVMVGESGLGESMTEAMVLDEVWCKERRRRE